MALENTSAASLQQFSEASRFPLFIASQCLESMLELRRWTWLAGWTEAIKKPFVMNRQAIHARWTIYTSQIAPSLASSPTDWYKGPLPGNINTIGSMPVPPSNLLETHVCRIVQVVPHSNAAMQNRPAAIQWTQSSHRISQPCFAARINIKRSMYMEKTSCPQYRMLTPNLVPSQRGFLIKIGRSMKAPVKW